MSVPGIIAVVGIGLLLLVVVCSVLSMARQQEEDEKRRQWEHDIRERLRKQREEDDHAGDTGAV
jgi:hypothetical protein